MTNKTSNFAFIFDLDGTLVDSFPQILNCLKKTSLELLMPPINEEITWELFGKPLIEIISANGIPQNQINEFIEIFRKNLRYEITLRNELFLGTSNLLSKILRTKSKIGIATSKPTDLAQLVCQNSDLSNYPFAIKGSEGIPPKPDPAVINFVMQTLEVTQGIMIGDRIEDIQAGKAAGIYTCAVLQSSHRRFDFLPINPDFIFESLEDLSDNLHEILKLIE